METISKILFWIADSLLIPDVIILILLFIKSLLYLGKFYNQFLTNKNNEKLLKHHIDNQDVESLKNALPQKDNSPYIYYLRQLLSGTPSSEKSEYLISNFETDADKDLSSSRLMSKVGPVLGLIGTLIAMSPALVGLSSGNISSMAYNMQVVFATTVVGLVVSLIGLITLQFKQRWYLKQSNSLYFVSQLILTKNEKI